MKERFELHRGREREYESYPSAEASLAAARAEPTAVELLPSPGGAVVVITFASARRPRHHAREPARLHRLAAWQRLALSQRLYLEHAKREAVAANRHARQTTGNAVPRDVLDRAEELKQQLARVGSDAPRPVRFGELLAAVRSTRLAEVEAPKQA